jgi:hypothetical protein
MTAASFREFATCFAAFFVGILLVAASGAAPLMA